MYMNRELHYYFQQLNAYLHAQNQKIEQLNEQINQLRQEIVQLKEKSQPSVVRNEYKFDLLKVEKLEGTLNIGLNPNGSDSAVGEFDVQQSVDVPQNPNQNPVFAGVQRQIYDYLKQEAFTVMQEIEKRCGYPLDDSYRNFIVDDVKKQIDKRIHYYLKQTPSQSLSEEQLKQLERSTIQSVKRDIEKTFEAFIRNLPGRDTKEP
ncbi:spore germination protein GerPC [Ammoniphilus resinae]|uniref:Spore germination protein PC n=1 Tax=Ammoniphilus resinae TaxID=861532 RepID=A0ABS4GQ61_9BACL|nr:spore germination protein GerPC [Ammoniphilus resinae]MBP1932404.1 spore germination protein PC [Ammoniphilus resinae]